jgi:O-antigen ligase
MRAVGMRDVSGSDVSARVLAVASALNLNGVFDMTLGIVQVASIMLLVGSVHLVAKHGRLPWSLPFMLIMSAFVAYLVFGTVVSDPMLAPPPFGFYRTYVGSMLLIWAIAGYTTWLGHGPRLGAYLEFVRNAFVVAAASIWASPVLYTFYAHLPPSHYERMGGFFENPNEAGVAACVALVLTLALPYRRALYQAIALLLVLVAVVLTLSKAAITAAIFVLAWRLVRQPRRGLVIVAMAALLVLPWLQDNSLLDGVADRLELNVNQRERLLGVGQIFGGKIDSHVTTGRTDLWQIGLDRAWKSFPFGSGLGSFHFIRGGIAEGEVWMGIHNTFLMFWGEAGVLPALLLIGGFAAMAIYAVMFARGGIELPMLIVIFMEMLGTHGALGLRHNNLVLGMTLGLLGFAAAAWHGATPLRFTLVPERLR